MKTKLLDMLWSIPSISGSEHQFSKMLYSHLNISDAWKTKDEHGNLYYGIGKHMNPDIVIVTHMDEIGLVVSSISKNGMLICYPRGLIYPKQYYGQQVKIYSQYGVQFGTVISNRSIQMNNESPLIIDIGCTDYNSALKKVCIGDSVLIDSSYHICHPSHIIGRALDNKIGIYILLNYIEQLYSEIKTYDDMNLCAVFSTGEEISSDSATKAVSILKPDVCIVIDGVNETKYSEMNTNKYGIVNAGFGALLYGKDYPVSLKMSYQKYGDSKYTNTEYDDISPLVKHCFLLGYPIKYMHSNGEMVNIQDIKDCEKILGIIVEYYYKKILSTNDMY